MTPSVRVHIDTWGVDKIPHAFISITHPDGRQIEFARARVLSEDCYD